MSFEWVIKRDGSRVPFQMEKIESAIEKAFEAEGGLLAHNSRELAEAVVICLQKNKKVIVPQIEEIQDMVELVLFNTGFAKVAKRYIFYRDKRREFRENLQIAGDRQEDYDDPVLPHVTSSRVSFQDEPWDAKIIQDKLVIELGLSNAVAREIAVQVEKRVLSLGFQMISTLLIQEIANHLLCEFGYGHLALKSSRIGMPAQDIEKLFYLPDKKLHPDQIRASIASHSLRQFTLHSIFSEDILRAYNNGQIHIQGLGNPAGFASCVLSLDYVKISGLNFEMLPTVSAPAKHLKVLITHMNTFLSCLRSYFYGPISLSSVNTLVAPFLEGLSLAEIEQEAQDMIFLVSQNAFTRGGEPLRLDINLSLEIPEELTKKFAIGPCGKVLDKTYGQYQKEALTFLRCLLACVEQGDAKGDSFVYPLVNVHLQQGVEYSANQLEVLEYACRVAMKRKEMFFFIDGSHQEFYSSQTQVNRLMSKNLGQDGEQSALVVLQSVILDLPSVFFKTGEARKFNLKDFELEIDRIIDLIHQIHLQKLKFLRNIANLESSMLTELLSIQKNGTPFVALDQTYTLIGFAGLEELIYLSDHTTVYQESGRKIAFEVIELLKKKIHTLSKSIPCAIEGNIDLTTKERLLRIHHEKRDDLDRFYHKLDMSSAHYSSGYRLNPTLGTDIGERELLEIELRDLVSGPSGVLCYYKVGKSAKDLFKYLLNRLL